MLAGLGAFYQFERGHMNYRFLSCTGWLLALLLSAPWTLASELALETVSATETADRPEHVADRYGMTFDAEQLTSGGVFEADLGTGHSVILHTLEVEERDGGTFTWRGEVHTDSGKQGLATLTVRNQRIRGRLELDRQRYLLFTDSEGQSWIDQVNPEKLPASHPEGGPPIPEESGDEAGEPIAAPQSSTYSPPTSHSHNDETNGEAEVDLLMFYTQASIDRYSDEEDLRLAMQNAVDSANTALRNSEVSNRLRLMGIYRWDDFIEDDTEGMNEGLEQFTDDPWVERLAELHSADLSALIADYSDFCGLAWLLTQYRDAWDFNYSVTAANQSCLGSQTLAHELGHNMGLRHNPDNAENPDNSIEEFAFGHFVEDDFQTIMTQNGACESVTSALGACRRLDNFSNPEVNDEVSDHPTGVHDERENARVLRLSMPHVQLWREPPLGLAEALGDPEGEYLTSGDSRWTVQDEVLFEDRPVAISGPVFGDEESVLTLVHASSEDFGVRFGARSFEAGARGVLEVRTENGVRKVIEGLTTDWETFEVGVPADTDELRWVWRAESGADAAEVGQALLKMEATGVEVEMEESAEESSSSGSDSILGCSLSGPGARDPVFPLLAAFALLGLLLSRSARRRSASCARS